MHNPNSCFPSKHVAESLTAQDIHFMKPPGGSHPLYEHSDNSKSIIEFGIKVTSGFLHYSLPTLLFVCALKQMDPGEERASWTCLEECKEQPGRSG